MAARAEAAALLALTLVLAGILPAARPTGRTSRALPQVLGAIPVAAVALGIVTAASGAPDPWCSSFCSVVSSRSCCWPGAGR